MKRSVRLSCRLACRLTLLLCRIAKFAARHDLDALWYWSYDHAEQLQTWVYYRMRRG